MKKIKKLNKLVGNIPLIYNPYSIHNMCVVLNAIVDVVNELNKRVEMLMEAHPTEKGGVQG